MSQPEPIGADGRRRGPGRPRAADRGSSISAWLTIEKHDQLIDLAKQEGKSVSQLVVEAVQRTYFDPILKP
jgi:hypothetical protein